MTVLCVDCGNTRLKWGLRGDGGWLAFGALPLAEASGLRAALSTTPVRIVACNVAGPAVESHLGALAATLGVPLSLARSQAQQCGVTNGYDDPSQLGADRWAALVGARGLHDGACLTVNAGTATTIDVLDAEGRFRGGLILPGLDMMRAALARDTAGLPLSRGEFREVPRNTDDAIASGCLHATLGAMERMYRQIANEEQPLCLLSGGAAGKLVPLLALPHREVPNLVLEGLARIAEGERKSAR
ncbi:MAG TPA: type III pantothenate kinase [Rhodocyclaceae bacterium]